MAEIVPFHTIARDGRRILPDGKVVDLQQYARTPDSRSVQISLPIELVAKIDALAKAELLPRSAWLRRQILAAIRKAGSEQATA